MNLYSADVGSAVFYISHMMFVNCVIQIFYILFSYCFILWIVLSVILEKCVKMYHYGRRFIRTFGSSFSVTFVLYIWIYFLGEYTNLGLLFFPDWIKTFVIVTCPYLYLLMIFSLKSLSDNNIVTQPAFWLMFAWCVLSNLLIFTFLCP